MNNSYEVNGSANEFLKSLMDKCDSEKEMMEIIQDEYKKKKFLDETIAKHGKPTRLNGGDTRYAWRPFGSNGAYIRGKTIESVYDKAWKAYIQSQTDYTLKQALDIYKEFKTNVSGSTRVKYEQNINMYLSDFLEVSLSTISAHDIVVAYMTTNNEKNPSEGTIKNFRGTLAAILEHICEHHGQKLQFDVGKLMKELRKETPKTMHRKKSILLESPEDCYTVEEAKAFLTECKKRDNILSYAAALSFFTGFRAGEMCGLYLEDVDMERHTIKVAHTAKVDKETSKYYIGSPKMNKERIWVFPDMAIPYIERILELKDNDTPYVFDNPCEKSRTLHAWISIRQLDNEIDNICKAVGMQRKSSHDIRRFVDSALCKSGMNDALRKILMGHEIEGIDAHYIRVTDSLEEIKKYVNNAYKDLE